jgi:predicted NBD/HSP70 family sugar kinase
VPPSVNESGDCRIPPSTGQRRISGIGPPWTGKNHSIMSLELQPPFAPAALRRLNASLILRAVQAKGTTSRPELAKATGLSQPTVNEIAALLLRSGRVVEASLEAAQRPMKRGPKAGLLCFNAAAGYVLGVDVSAEQILVLLGDLSGRIVGRLHKDVGARETLRPEPLLARTRAAIAGTLRNAGIARSKLLGMGVSLPGIVDPSTGRASLIPTLLGWEGLPAAKRFGAGFACPVTVNCDLHVASLAERAFGAAREAGDAVYVHLGVGIGLGILMRGEPYLGADGAVGQIGFLPIGDDDAPPEAGFGLFEWSAGSSAFARLARDTLAKGRAGRSSRSPIRRGKNSLGPRAVFEAVRAGDKDAERILARLIERIAQGVAAVICVLNPEAVILGGEISQGKELLLDPLRARVADLVPRPPRQFLISTLGEDSAALGALQVALRQAEERIFEDPTTKAA